MNAPRVPFPQPIFRQTNGINLACYESGDGDPVILLHGFPELAYSWRYQLPALADAGFHAIAPDLRGYGATDCPPDVRDYRIQELVADICGLLDHLGLESAHFVGHDWGAILLWQFALMAPQRVRSMAVLNIPFYPRPPADPIEIFRRRLGERFYIVNFQDSDEADRVFAEDPRRFINNVMRQNQLPRDRFDALPPEAKVISLLATARRETPSGDPLLDERDLDIFTAAFERTGFTPAINWYRNMSENWSSTDALEQRVRPPVLFIGARDDLVIPLEDIDRMRDHVEQLQTRVLSPCGHWTQQERPGDVNRLLLAFFREN